MDKCLLVKKLNVKLVGHYRYYGITCNYRRLSVFMQYVKRQLFKALNRKSQRKMSWETYGRFLKNNPLTPARIYHSFART